MEDFVKVFTNYSYQWIVGIFFTFLGYLGKKLLNTYKDSIEFKKKIQEQELEEKKKAALKETEEQALIKDGMLALLRFRVNRICFHIKEQGFMTLDEKIDLDDLYKTYENLGGNSRAHELYEYTIKNYDVKSY